MTNKEMKKQVIELVGKSFYEMFFVNTVMDLCEEEVVNSPNFLNLKPYKFSHRKWVKTLWNRKYRELCKKVLSIPDINTETARMTILQAGFSGGMFLGRDFEKFVTQ